MYGLNVCDNWATRPRSDLNLSEFWSGSKYFIAQTGGVCNHLALKCHHCIVLYDFLEAFLYRSDSKYDPNTDHIQQQTWRMADSGSVNGIDHHDLVEGDKTTPHRETGTRTKRRRQKTMECGTPRGGGGLPSFSSVWWSLDGFRLPDLHLPSRLKKFSSSSRPYSGPAGPPSDSFTALVNFTWNAWTQNT